MSGESFNIPSFRFIQFQAQLDGLLEAAMALNEDEVRSRNVFVRSTFEAVHHYPDADDEVDFLRHPHRHLFHVGVQCEVGHDNRDIEFLTLKEHLDSVLLEIANSRSTLSCEQFCHIIRYLLVTEYGYRTINMVSVVEDGENGSNIWFNEHEALIIKEDSNGQAQADTPNTDSSTA